MLRDTYKPKNIKTCWNCKHFKNKPDEIEQMIPGLKVLSSAYSSVRGDAGICMVNQTYLFPQTACMHFSS